MSIKNFLSSEEKYYLQNALKKEDRAEVRERILIFLLENDGKNYQEIADFLGCSVRTVAYWSAHGNPNDIESLQNKSRNGNHHKATPEYRELLLKVVDIEPSTFGYEFGGWTGKRLSEHLEKETGIKLSKSQIQRILKKNKYVYIWSKYSPDYNLIELVWHSAKEYIAHRDFENVEELEKIIKRLLNENQLKINWSKKFKNKGNLINAS